MAIILQIDFPYSGPWGDEMFESFKTLADSIANEKGLIWKIWTENEASKEAGGIYLFESQADAEDYLNMHLQRLKENGFTECRHRIFAVNSPLSKLNFAPV